MQARCSDTHADFNGWYSAQRLAKQPDARRAMVVTTDVDVLPSTPPGSSSLLNSAEIRHEA
jgi:hypothetical protein